MSTGPGEVLVEVYACEWQDESFRTGWGVVNPLYHVFNTDGDVATISCSVEAQQARAEKELPDISTGVARYLAVKVVGFSGDGWGIQVRDTGGSWHDITGVQTATGYVELELPEGLTLDRIAIISYGPGSYAKFDWLGLLRKPRLLLRASSLRVVRRLNACSEFEVECPSPRAAEAHVMNHVKIIVDGRKVLCGLVLAREVRREGAGVAWARLSGADYAWYLMSREAGRRTYSGYIHEVIRQLVSGLVQDGLLTTDNVAESDVQVELDLSDEALTVLEALNRLCRDENVGYDFFVDFGSDLHAFPRGSRQQTDLALKPLAYTIRQEAGDVVNSATVLGAVGKVLPDDGDYANHPELWSCPSGNATLAQDEGVFFLSAPSLRIEQAGDGGVVVRLFFPEPLDLEPELGSTRRKELRFYVRWEGTYEPTLIIRCWDGDRGYFEHPNCLEIVPPGRWGIPDMGRTRAVALRLGSSAPGWEAHGSPSWRHITHVDFLVDVGAGGRMWLDQVHLANFRFRGHAQDNESIRAYGLRHITLLDSSITSDEEAQARAEAIVASRSQPDVRLEDITVLGVPELEPGAKIHVELSEVEGDYVVAELQHTITPQEGFRTRIACSRTGEVSPGWPQLFSGRQVARPSATDVAREERDNDEAVAPQARLPSSFVVTHPNRLLSDFFTEDGRIKLSELERWPFTGEDLASGSIEHAHLRPELSKAIGYFYEAEDWDGTTGSDVADGTASGGWARRANASDPGGSLVEVA